MSLMRLLLPFGYFALSFADGAGAAGGGGSKDGDGSGAGKTPSSKAADDKSADAATIAVPKKDYERLTGRLGQLEDAERRRADEKKKADEEEAKKRGEHEKLLAEREKEIDALRPWQDRYAKRVKADHERRIKIIEKCDDKVRGQFKAAADGHELSVEEMEANLAKLDEYETLGLLTPKRTDSTVVVRREPAGGHDKSQDRGSERRSKYDLIQ